MSRGVGHDGLVPGVTSQMSLAPDDGVGVVVFTNGAGGAMAWLGGEVTAVLGRILGAPEPVVRADVPHHPEIWADVCGWYSSEWPRGLRDFWCLLVWAYPGRWA